MLLWTQVTRLPRADGHRVWGQGPHHRVLTRFMHEPDPRHTPPADPTALPPYSDAPRSAPPPARLVPHSPARPTPPAAPSLHDPSPSRTAAGPAPTPANAPRPSPRVPEPADTLPSRPPGDRASSRDRSLPPAPRAHRDRTASDRRPRA